MQIWKPQGEAMLGRSSGRANQRQGNFKPAGKSQRLQKYCMQLFDKTWTKKISAIQKVSISKKQNNRKISRKNTALKAVTMNDTGLEKEKIAEIGHPRIHSIFILQVKNHTLM